MRAAGDQAIPLHALKAHGFADLGDREEVPWASGDDLLKDEATWVPLDAASLDRTRDDCGYWQSSDGLASGNTRTEATLHGMLERIERDAEVLWRMMPLARRLQPCLDPAAFGDEVVSDLAGRIVNAGLTLRLFDITSDIAEEILHALSHDIKVYGASMVALRAAKCADFGMIGVGRISQHYAAGALEDDADVALLHGPAELGYLPLTVPLGQHAGDARAPASDSRHHCRCRGGARAGGEGHRLQGKDVV